MISISIVIPINCISAAIDAALLRTLESINLLLSRSCLEIIIVIPRESHKITNHYSLLLSKYDKFIIKLVPESSPSHSGALNTGSQAAIGSHVLVLNPGDLVIATDATETLLSCNDINAIYIFNTVSDFRFIGNIVSKIAETGGSHTLKSHCKHTFITTPHQSILIPKSLFSLGLKYNEKYSFRMDYALLTEIQARYWKTKTFFFPTILSYYPPGGKSMHKRNRFPFYTEQILIDIQYHRLTSLHTLIRWIYWAFRAVKFL